MTPRGGPTLDFSLFGRYFLDLAIFYPGAFLCLAPLWEHVKAPRRTAVLTAALVTVICLAAAALCAIFELDSNILLLPTLLAAFWLLRWRVGPEVSVSQTAFLFAVSGVMTAVCTLLSTVLNARAEVGNDAPACLVSTSLLKLGLSAVLCIIFWFTAVQWSRWLLREYRGEAFWQSAWPLPTIYAAFLVFCMPLDPAVVLINRLMIISVLAVTISLLGIFLLLYEMYQVAREYTRSAQLDRENQLLAVESRRYTELRTYMEQTRHLRHDFRQHLHVIAGLTEAGQVDELKNYLHQYESELSEERPTLCANPAVDALAGHYDHEAHSLGVPVDWRLELPRQLAIPEADFCMMLGNLLENALHASQKLPREHAQKPRRTEAEVIEQCPWAATGKAKDRKPNIITSLELKPEAMEINNLRFQAKYRQIEENEVRFEEINCEDAEYLIIAFGSMARIGQKAMELAREKGIKVGILRPITLWPFPTKAIAAYADKVKGMLVTELNAGQMIEDVRLAVNGKIKVEHFGRLGGIVPDPDEIVTALEEKIIK